jgi:nitrite reductase/ring-hydroxylating ferredoxin subunit
MFRIARKLIANPFQDVNEETMATLELCKTSEVDEGTAKKVEAGGLVLAVFNLNGAYYVLDDVCSHGPGSLSEGYIQGEMIECDFHNGGFNIKTGEVMEPPCLIPQKTYPVTVKGDTVTIEA